MTKKEIDSFIQNISANKSKRQQIFNVLDSNIKAQVLLKLGSRVQRDLVLNLSDEHIVSILEHLDPDEATDILQLLPKSKQLKITKKLGDDLRSSIEILSQFDSQTAAGLMSLDYIQVDVEDNIEEVAKQFRIHEERTGRLPMIIVMDNSDLKGYIPGHELGFASPKEKLDKYIKKVITISHDVSDNKVIEFFQNHPHQKIVVLGPNKNVVGIIYSDDVLQLVKRKEAHSLYKFAGLSNEESVLDSSLDKVKSRYKWLIINLGTAFLAAFVVSLFEETISKYVLLAVYMPIVAGMGGNAATQTLAVVVRGIALEQINLNNYWPTLKKELEAAFFNGIINGILVAFIVVIFNNDFKVAMILAMAMIANMLVAAFFGTLIPLVMKKLDKDPATSATIFITTATDVLGFLAFLGLGTVLL